MKTEKQITAIRAELTSKIRSAVEAAGGCIGTYYKNLGVHHTEIDFDNSDEYGDSFAVVVKSDYPADYGGYTAASVFDIYIDPETSMLEITLNGESGDDFDELLEHVQVEGLVKIVEWLTKNGFIVREKKNPWRCEECGSLNVEQKVWVDSNSDEPAAQDSCDRNELWCSDCEEHTGQIQENVLLDIINDWFENHLEPDDPEVISGLDPDDYATGEEYDAACLEFWSALTNEEKISIWKSLTYDKRCNGNY